MKHLIPEFEKLKARFPAGFESSLVLPCVRRIQEDRGFVADTDIDGLVEYLGVPRIQIEEVLSYYTQFRRKPIGRWHLQACRNVTCSMRSAERLIDHLARRLDVSPGQTTPDGTVHAVDGRVPGLLRHRSGGDGQRHVSREHEHREARPSSRGIEGGMMPAPAESHAAAEASLNARQAAADDVPRHGHLPHACGLRRPAAAMRRCAAR